jgi:hypothetical protein
VADVDFGLRRKLADIRAQIQTAKRDASWNQTLWSGAWASVDAEIQAKKAEAKAVKDAEVKAKAEAKEEEEDLLRILRLAQSGKRVQAPKPSFRQSQVLAPKSVRPVVILSSKNPLVADPRPNPESIAEFPVLGSSSVRVPKAAPAA